MFPRFNHWLARLDAGEALKAVSPVRRKIAPVLGLGLAASVIGYNAIQAPNAETRKKNIVRDGLVLLGVLLGLQAGMRGSKKLLGEAAEEACHHFHPKKLLDRVTSLFRASAHDHGTQAFVSLGGLSLGGVVGGGLGGILADWINKEDLRETAPAKLKEGLFQFIGNVMFCTLAILVLGKVGKVLGKALFSIAEKTATQQTAKTLVRYAEKESNNLALMPTKLTESIQTILHEHRGQAEKAVTEIKELLQHELADIKTLHAPLESLESRLRDSLLQGGDSAVHQAVREFYGKQIKEDLTQLASHHPQELKTVAQVRFEEGGKLAGTLAGLVTGIVGGAWVSNKFNRFLTEQFNLPEGHNSIGLFGNHNHGWMEGTVGERGIHWWDAVLHVDDWPTALYMAGVHSLEAVLHVLYGMSGYLTGTAGTGNHKNHEHGSKAVERHDGGSHAYPHMHLLADGSQPLNRNQQAFQRFMS